MGLDGRLVALSVLFQEVTAAVADGQLPSNVDPIAFELLKWLLGGISAFGIAILTIYFHRRKDIGDVVRAAMIEHDNAHIEHNRRHDRFEQEVRDMLGDANRAIAVVETQIGPFWKLVESTILPRFGGVIPPPNPITDEQRDAMVNYVTHRENTPIEQVYLAREGFGIELSENKDLNQDEAIFYSMAWFAANGRIAEHESRVDHT